MSLNEFWYTLLVIADIQEDGLLIPWSGCGTDTKVFPFPASKDYIPRSNLDIKTLSTRQNGKVVTHNVVHKITMGVLCTSLSLLHGRNTETQSSDSHTEFRQNLWTGLMDIYTFMNLSKLGITLDQSGYQSELLDDCKWTVFNTKF